MTNDENTEKLIKEQQFKSEIRSAHRFFDRLEQENRDKFYLTDGVPNNQLTDADITMRNATDLELTTIMTERVTEIRAIKVRYGV